MGNISNNKIKNKLNCWEIILMVISVIPLYYLSIRYITFGIDYNFPWRFISPALVVFIILAFDLIWFLLLKKYLVKNRLAWIIMSIVVFTLSLFILTDLYLAATWSTMW